MCSCYVTIMTAPFYIVNIGCQQCLEYITFLHHDLWIHFGNQSQKNNNSTHLITLWSVCFWSSVLQSSVTNGSGPTEKKNPQRNLIWCCWFLFILAEADFFCFVLFLYFLASALQRVSQVEVVTFQDPRKKMKPKEIPAPVKVSVSLRDISFGVAF